jgi:hypothetical protein
MPKARSAEAKMSLIRLQEQAVEYFLTQYPDLDAESFPAMIDYAIGAFRIAADQHAKCAALGTLLAQLCALTWWTDFDVEIAHRAYLKTDIATEHALRQMQSSVRNYNELPGMITAWATFWRLLAGAGLWLGQVRSAAERQLNSAVLH